jgi:hypothetical protein
MDRIQNSLFNCKQGQDVFGFSTTSRPAVGPIQLPIQWAPGVFQALGVGVKRPGVKVTSRLYKVLRLTRDSSVGIATG